MVLSHFFSSTYIYLYQYNVLNVDTCECGTWNQEHVEKIDFYFYVDILIAFHHDR